MLKLSVVIPLFNAERYIEKCVSSLELQDVDRKLYEIIVVDDGSTDSSSDLVARLQGEYDNIVILHQNNSGPGGARNRGLCEANGEFVLFVDADDYVIENCLGTMLSVADNGPVDFVGFGFTIHFNSGLVSALRFPEVKSESITGIEFAHCYLQNNSSVCRYLFNRRFLLSNNLFFMEGITFEDVELVPRIMCLAKRTRFYDLPFYQYFIRPGSTMTSICEKHIWSFLAAAEHLYSFMVEHSPALCEQELFLLNNTIAECLLASVSACHRFPGKLRQLSDTIDRLPFYPLNLARCSKYQGQIWLLNSSVLLFWLVSYVRDSVMKVLNKGITATKLVSKILRFEPRKGS